jgi:hypothetical protein
VARKPRKPDYVPTYAEWDLALELHSLKLAELRQAKRQAQVKEHRDVVRWENTMELKRLLDMVGGNENDPYYISESRLLREQLAKPMRRPQSVKGS